jgi:hypothetical protein
MTPADTQVIGTPPQPATAAQTISGPRCGCLDVTVWGHTVCALGSMQGQPRPSPMQLMFGGVRDRGHR